MRASLLTIAIAALLAAASAQAQVKGNVRYKWHDGDGLLHFSDTLTQESMKYGFEVVNDQGLITQRVPRQLTADERVTPFKVATEEAAKQRVEKDRVNSETQMMAVYSDEASFKAYQQRSLDTVAQLIETTQINITAQAKALAELLASAAEMDRTQKQVPSAITEKITVQRGVVTRQRATMERLHASRAQMLLDQASELARYRHLKAIEKK